jgi:myo-inositol-1(or 4)-monophosphatase
LITAAAEAAAPIALRYWRSDQKVEYKDGGSPVGEADYAVDTFLRDHLTTARPDYGWLSEETEDSAARLSTARQFIVDPIDGTRSFVEGNATWGISIAVVEHGVPVAGVVALPARGKVYTAALGAGAQRDRQPLAAGTRAQPEGATVLAPKPSLDPKWWAEAPPKLERHFRPSLAYRFCLVAEGRFDAILTIRDAYEWDIAAGVLIAQEAGARVTDRNGAPLRFNSVTAKAAGVFGAAPALHNHLIGLYTGATAR